MKTQPKPQKVQKQLQAYRKEYEREKARLQKVGFFFKGSITQRRLPCGNPNCRCRKPKHWHGPYYQISWKEKGKTVSRFIPAKIVHLYREWIDNARSLTSILHKMQVISRKVADRIQTAETTRGGTKKKGKAQRKTT